MSSFVDIINMKLKLDNKYVLNNVNLNLNKGDRCLLLGINGSGKSCLLRTLAGMHIVTEGSLIIDKKRSFQDQCNGLAFLGESWSRSVAFSGHSIAYQADIKVKDMMKKVQKENIERKKILTRVLGINPEWRMHLVSSGQRRRVRLFLGLLKPFKIALIDEMTMDLDIITRIKFMEWLKKESIDNKACIIYATHIFDGLNDWPTHIAHIKPGGILNNIILIDTQTNDTSQTQQQQKNNKPNNFNNTHIPTTKKDFYKILGVDRNVSRKDIRKAYYNKAKLMHPDINKDDPNATENFAELQSAYECLYDPERRDSYNKFGYAGASGIPQTNKKTYNIKKEINRKIEKLAHILLNQDYEFLESKNIIEQEDGPGIYENKRSKNKSNGPQRGYGSGRLNNVTKV